MKRVEHLIISGQANEYLKMDSLNSRKTTISVRSITWCDEIWYNFEMRSGIVSCLKLLWFSPMRSSSKVIQPKWSVEVLYHLPSSIHPSTHSPPWISNYKKCSFFVIWNQKFSYVLFVRQICYVFSSNPNLEPPLTKKKLVFAFQT